MDNDQGQNEMIEQRIQKMQEMKASGVEVFKENFHRTHTIEEVIESFEDLKGQSITLAGRIMGQRQHGKATFADLHGQREKIQLYLNLKRLGEEDYGFFQRLDTGDFVGAKGQLFTTRRGEKSLQVESFELLSKSLRPFPEKFHGLKDVELRHRQRYLDLIVNPEVKEIFRRRSLIVKAFRTFLEGRGFLEVETPMMQPMAGGANARPFVTHHNALDMDLYLRIAPELYLKRLIVGGFERVFEINKNFRNEGISRKHNPEFTMMELYQAYADYHDMMELTEELVAFSAQEALGTMKVGGEEETIDLTPPWPRKRMVDSIEEFTGYAIEDRSREDLLEIADTLSLEVEEGASRGLVINQIFEEKVEPNLIQPIFILDYPVEVSPLARKRSDDPAFTCRFEAFIQGQEIANAFSELNDPLDQKQRFADQVKRREEGDEEAHEMDYDYIRALEYGMPPTGGLGIGIDRLVMVLTNTSNIREVILFPLLRPEV